jgi:hypothetical protein
MKIKIVVHEAEEGGFWAEVPAIPGCATEGETMEELLRIARGDRRVPVGRDSGIEDVKNGFWKLPYETVIRPRICALDRTARLAATTY